MNEPIAFTQLPRPVQFQLAALGPLLFGLVCGFFLGISAESYWAVNALAVAAGVLGGLEVPAAGPARPPARSPRAEAAVRGALAGAMFGLGVFIAHVASGDRAHAPLPSPVVLIVVISAVVGCGLAFAGAAAMHRRT
jgi:hypothetical protein